MPCPYDFPCVSRGMQEKRQNLQVIRCLGLLARLLFLLQSDPHILHVARDVLFNLFTAILQPLPDAPGLLKCVAFVLFPFTFYPLPRVLGREESTSSLSFLISIYRCLFSLNYGQVTILVRFYTMGR